MTLKDFITKAREVHGDKYDYSKVVYVNDRNKAIIICAEHGDISSARKVHSDKYNNSNVEYIDKYTKVCIICPKHGEFWKTPYDHFYGRGCPKCHAEQKRKNQTLC